VAPWWDHPIARLFVAAVLGAALGLEREYHGKSAGLRTNTMITLGAALFTLISIRLTANASETDRIAAQIVTGVGFLGGGAILRSRQGVHGLTTAATIWVNAAIGMAAGAGEFTLAIAGAAIAFLTLVGLEPAEQFFDRRIRDGQPSQRDQKL
jgi:putative Mg2+ transporter-C (MgtC) family protein